MQQELHSRKKTFNFQDDPSQIKHVPLSFERCVEYSEDMSNDNLIDFIMREAENFRQQQLRAVSGHPHFSISKASEGANPKHALPSNFE